jgi:isoleucyl-tRNA synthetase
MGSSRFGFPADALASGLQPPVSSLMFFEVPQLDIQKVQQEILDRWEREGTFQDSVKHPPASKQPPQEVVFYDGPPFPTGAPHHGTVLVSVIKDFIARYLTMRGNRVPRVWGWDCHGLPIETAVEKQLGIGSKKEIEEKIGVAAFNEACKSLVDNCNDAWRVYIREMARWVDYDNAYRTMDFKFMESVLWAFGECYNRDLIYRDYRVTPYCTRCETSLSVSDTRESDATRPRQDPSVVVRFKLHVPEMQISGAKASGNQPSAAKPTYALVWTTTPWTLPSNLALAVNAGIDYATIETPDAKYVLAAALAVKHASLLGKDAKQVGTVKGATLAGTAYEPLFPYFANRAGTGKTFRIVPADYVDVAEGTGIVHLAPAFGEDDFVVCKANNIPPVNPVDAQGRFTAEVPEFAGRHVLEANRDIIRALKQMGVLVEQSVIEHNYPHCWRCREPLIYRAMDAWYLSIAKIKDDLLRVNETINWVPETVKGGRFGKWLENARDWNISRNRYWGTPIPVWICDQPKCGKRDVLGDVATIEQRTGVRVADLHRQTLDPLEYACDCGGTMRRTPEVLDCWFESGAMPFGQCHYPFENKDWFEQHFPSDFIVEYTGQIRCWFYYLHVLAVALFNRPAFKNCIVHGTILAKDGKKISKSSKNYTDPMDLMKTNGTDSLRLYLLQSTAVIMGDLNFDDEGPKEFFRRALLPLWNAYSFFISYARLDGWQPTAKDGVDGESAIRYSDFVIRHSLNPLDRWILARLYQTEKSITECMDAYQIDRHVPRILEFIDDLTNWYIRRSRRRFWASGLDADKQSAYETLYYVLVTTLKLLAPAAPIIAEAMYANLAPGESIHLQPWPVIPESCRDDALIVQTTAARQLIHLGLGLRQKHQIRTRQPLATLDFVLPLQMPEGAVDGQLAIVAEELNVKQVVQRDDVSTIATARYIPDFKQLGPVLGKEMPQVAAAIKAGNVRFEGDKVIVTQGDKKWTVDPTMVQIHYDGKDGHDVMSEGGFVVALDTTITPELLSEGDARELVRNIQDLRKDADYAISDRITVHLHGPYPHEWVAYIMDEVLGTLGDVEKPDREKQVEISAGLVTIRIQRDVAANSKK